MLAKKVKAVYYNAVDLIDKDRKCCRPLLPKYLGLSESDRHEYTLPKLDEDRDTRQGGHTTILRSSLQRRGL